MLRTFAATARTLAAGPAAAWQSAGKSVVSTPRSAPPGGGRRVVGPLGDWTYLRAGVVAIAAAVVFAIALPLAAGVFDHVRPFDINDPNFEVERAYAAYEHAQGVVSDADVALLVSGPAAARTADVERRLAAVNGVAERVRACRRPTPAKPRRKRGPRPRPLRRGSQQSRSRRGREDGL